MKNGTYPADVLKKEQRSLSGVIRSMEKEEINTDTEQAQLKALDIAIQLLEGHAGWFEHV